MKQLKDRAIILKRINYGERDRILTLLCQEQGKVSVLAKAVRAEKSKLAGGIELLSETEVSMVESNSDIMILTGSRLKNHFGHIINEPQRLELAFRFQKLLDKFIDERAGQEYYPILLTALEALNSTSYDGLIVDIWMQVRTLQLHGSSPNLIVYNGERFDFNFDKQQFFVSPEGLFVQNDIKLLRLCQKSTRPPKLDRELSSKTRLSNLARELIKLNISEI